MRFGFTITVYACGCRETWPRFCDEACSKEKHTTDDANSTCSLKHSGASCIYCELENWPVVEELGPAASSCQTVLHAENHQKARPRVFASQDYGYTLAEPHRGAIRFRPAPSRADKICLARSQIEEVRSHPAGMLIANNKTKDTGFGAVKVTSQWYRYRRLSAPCIPLYTPPTPATCHNDSGSLSVSPDTSDASFRSSTSSTGSEIPSISVTIPFQPPTSRLTSPNKSHAQIPTDLASPASSTKQASSSTSSEFPISETRPRTRLPSTEWAAQRLGMRLSTISITHKAAEAGHHLSRQGLLQAHRAARVVDGLVDYYEHGVGKRMEVWSEHHYRTAGHTLTKVGYQEVAMPIRGMDHTRQHQIGGNSASRRQEGV